MANLSLSKSYLQSGSVWTIQRLDGLNHVSIGTLFKSYDDAKIFFDDFGYGSFDRIIELPVMMKL